MSVDSQQHDSWHVQSLVGNPCSAPPLPPQAATFSLHSLHWVKIFLLHFKTRVRHPRWQSEILAIESVMSVAAVLQLCSPPKRGQTYMLHSCFDLISFSNDCILSRFFSFILTNNKFSFLVQWQISYRYTLKRRKQTLNYFEKLLCLCAASFLFHLFIHGLQFFYFF